MRDVPRPAPAGESPKASAAASHTATPGPAELSADVWLRSADSALRRQLELDMFLAKGGYAPGFQDCSDDDGSDNPTLQAAAVALRPIGNSGAAVDSSAEYPRIMRRTTFRVEARSVAIMIPHWIARFHVDSFPQDAEPYAAVIAPRVDTFSIAVAQFAGVRTGPDMPSADAMPAMRWTVCDPGGPAVSEGDGPGFWGFAHAGSTWMRVMQWSPPNGSWAGIVALADSAARATSPP
jgi:hypothetical protein